MGVKARAWSMECGIRNGQWDGRTGALLQQVNLVSERSNLLRVVLATHGRSSFGSSREQFAILRLYSAKVCDIRALSALQWTKQVLSPPLERAAA